MAEYQLYCFDRSGNSYKPALILELAGADREPRLAVLALPQGEGCGQASVPMFLSGT